MIGLHASVITLKARLTEWTGNTAHQNIVISYRTSSNTLSYVFTIVDV